MRIEPSQAHFTERYCRGEPQVVWTSLVADLETPVSAYLKLGHAQPMSFLFESVEGGAVRGRYSIIGLAPDVVWRAHGAKAEINRAAATQPCAFAPCPEPPLAALRGFIAESRIALPDHLPPMAAGIFGYLGYDIVRLLEDLPTVKPDPIGIPDAILMRPTIVVVFDAVRDSITVITPVRPRPDVSAEIARARAAERLAAVVEALDRTLDKSLIVAEDHPPGAPARSNTTPDEYKAMVMRAKDYIAAGDAFQIVLAQRFEAPFALPPFALYRALRRINPAPFLFYLDFGNFSVAGGCLEKKVRVRNGIVTIRPLAGTRPRGATHEEDIRLEQELLADPKERAEHLMLLDLGRNDVGRVAELGSVRVTESFAIERFSHVMHIMSDVQGKLRAGLDAVDALIAGFPAGTLTGAPKVRAMEIIEELEPTKRGIYAGCIGYFASNGTMDTCIGLRMAVIKDGMMHVQAGCGVVADSRPEAEYEETRQKARALFRAAEEAVRFAALGG